MRKSSFATVVIVGVIAALLMVTPQTANAGCKRLQPRGPLICADWITGSQVCELLLKGLKGNIAAEAKIECGVFGTYYGSLPANTDMTPYDPECDPSSDSYEPSLGCFIPGKAKCLNPSGHYNPNGTAFNYPEPLFKDAAPATCDKGGKCTTSAIVDASGSGLVCPNTNWSLAGFTAERFFGAVCVCPGGYDDEDQCCLDDKRLPNGNCKTKYNVGDEAGTPDCLVEFCTYVGDFYGGYLFGEETPYLCFETNPD